MNLWDLRTRSDWIVYMAQTGDLDPDEAREMLRWCRKSRWRRFLEWCGVAR